MLPFWCSQWVSDFSSSVYRLKAIVKLIKDHFFWNNCHLWKWCTHLGHELSVPSLKLFFFFLHFFSTYTHTWLALPVEMHANIWCSSLHCCKTNLSLPQHAVMILLSVTASATSTDSVSVLHSFHFAVLKWLVQRLLIDFLERIFLYLFLILHLKFWEFTSDVSSARLFKSFSAGTILSWGIELPLL